MYLITNESTMCMFAEIHTKCSEREDFSKLNWKIGITHNVTLLIQKLCDS